MKCNGYFSSQQESYSLHKLDSSPPLESVLTREQFLAYYKEMVEVREMEMAARDLYLKKIIRGFLHVFVGQVSCKIAKHCQGGGGSSPLIESRPP